MKIGPGSDTASQLTGQRKARVFYAETQGPKQRINPWRKFTGAMVPNWLLCRPEVSPGAKLCYARLAQYAGKENTCHPRQETLGRELGISARTVRDYLRELERFALLESERPGRGRANRYYFLSHPWMYRDKGRSIRTGCSELNRQNTSVPERGDAAAPLEENQGRESERVNTRREQFLQYLPSTEEEAVTRAVSVSVPPAFARTEFNRLVGVGWIDGCQRPIKSWEHYMKSRWAYEQSQRAERVSRSRATIPTSSPTKFVRPEEFGSGVGKL